MMNRILYVGLILVFIISCSCAKNGEINCERPKSCVKISNNDEFEYLLYLIEYGNTESINMSKKLIKYTDAEKTESILIALGRALNKNTEAVLRLVKNDDSFNVDQICTVPFIEAPKDIENIHIRQAIYNLGLIEDIELKETRDKCLELFQEMSKINQEILLE